MPCRAPRRWRGGAMGTSRPTAKPHEGCARDAKPRTALRRGGAMGTSRPTATGHKGCARRCCAGVRTQRGAGGARDAMPYGARRVLRFDEKWLLEWIFCKSDWIEDFFVACFPWKRYIFISLRRSLGAHLNPASEQPTSRTMREAQMWDGSLKTEPLFRAIQACRTRMRGRGGVARQQSKFVL